MAITEKDLEQLCIQWLQMRNLITRRFGAGTCQIRGHYLVGRLETALRRSNPTLPAVAIDDALRRTPHYAGTSLIEANRFPEQ